MARKFSKMLYILSTFSNITLSFIKSISQKVSHNKLYSSLKRRIFQRCSAELYVLPFIRFTFFLKEQLSLDISRFIEQPDFFFLSKNELLISLYDFYYKCAHLLSNFWRWNSLIIQSRFKSRLFGLRFLCVFQEVDFW